MSASVLTIDDFLHRFGDFGNFQRRHYAVVAGAWMAAALCTFSNVFVTRRPPWVEPGSQIIHRGPLPCATGAYDIVEPWRTVAGEFNLVCARGYIKSLIDSLFFVGFGIGAAAFGNVSDSYFGRRLALILALTGTAAFNLAAACSTSVVMFAALRALSGVPTGGIGVCAYVWAAEFIGPKRTGIAGVCQAMIFSVGCVLLVLLALAFPGWRSLTACTGSCAAAYALALLPCYESPRWLLSRGRHEEARHVLLAIATANGASLETAEATVSLVGNSSVHGGSVHGGNGGSNGHLPNAPAAAPSTAAPVNGMIRIVARPTPPDDPSIVTSDHVAVLDPSRLRSDEYAINGCSSNGSNNGSHHGTSYAPVSLVTLFTSKPLRQRLPPMLFAWASTSFSYYGLSLDSSNLGASLHLNFALMSAIEIPAILIGAVLIEWPPLGRRYTLAGGFALGGIACIICAVLSGKDEGAGDDDGIGPIQLSALAGKFAIAATFAIVFPYTAELFPTQVRNRAVGLCSTCARVGSVAAPPVVLLAEGGAALPMLVFASAAILAGAWAATLPETRGRPALETVEELR